MKTMMCNVEKVKGAETEQTSKLCLCSDLGSCLNHLNVHFFISAAEISKYSKKIIK